MTEPDANTRPHRGVRGFRARLQVGAGGVEVEGGGEVAARVLRVTERGARGAPPEERLHARRLLVQHLRVAEAWLMSAQAYFSLRVVDRTDLSN
jgi:hypothetical protein